MDFQWGAEWTEDPWITMYKQQNIYDHCYMVSMLTSYLCRSPQKLFIFLLIMLLYKYLYKYWAHYAFV